MWLPVISASHNQGLFLQGKVLYMCHSLFQSKSWRKLEQITDFLLAEQSISMYTLIYMAGFPGIAAWNVLLNFTCVGEIYL